jgi:chromosome segregation ATPase
MKNVDVPLWDKGDDTDSFSKGGASASSFSMRKSSVKKSPLVKKIYKQILGREPSSREMAYYKYSSAKKEDIIKKLLEGEEHEEILEKAKKYPELEETNSKLKSKVLKLKSKVKDNEEEFKQLKSLLEEKNTTIKELRESKEVPPYLDGQVLEENGVHYSVSSAPLKEVIKRDKTFWDRLRYLIMGE